MPTDNNISFDDWLKLGYENGWCGPVVCYTHDGIPTSHEEDIEFDDSDPCIHIIRMYDRPETKTAVEENHSPSLWRASNSGLGRPDHK